ncbi:DUF4115 domain-containing protein [Chloroflexi bacterium CFX6]|nr:DUF4115 domain-containing protein [Chloroflexi bacterium CFX6]
MMQTIGQRLKAAREEKQLTLDRIFEATRIRVNYLRALEDDDLSVMPSPVQARGYLRNYAEYLGLDIDRLLEEMRSSQQTAGEIIGPADLADQPAIESPQEAVTAPDETPPSPPTVDSVRETESQPEPTPAKPKRRGRKKAEAEPSPVIEPTPEEIAEPVPQPEPLAAEIVESQPEEPSQPDAGDTLWQTWLNRLDAVINRKAGTKDDAIAESSEAAAPPEPSQSETDAAQPEASGVEQPQRSDEIFKEIGAKLRERRETLSLHLEEVERNTRVKAHYLEALERGDMKSLPSTVQTRGMLSNYASFLDMDVDAILLRFADALQARHREKNPQRPARKRGGPILANIPVLQNFIVGDMIFGIGIAILLVGFIIWGINRVLTLQSLEEIQPTAPSISDVLLASPDPSLFTATATLLPVESFEEEATPTIIVPTLNVNVSVQVNLVALERTYVRVIADGEVAFEGRVIPGNAYLFEAEDQVEVLAGSGAAIRIAYNGRDLGLMGTFGQIVHNIYRAEEVVTPTPLATATPTNTLPSSPTPSPTNTPTPSRTPTP